MRDVVHNESLLLHQRMLRGPKVVGLSPDPRPKQGEVSRGEHGDYGSVLVRYWSLRVRGEFLARHYPESSICLFGHQGQARFHNSEDNHGRRFNHTSEGNEDSPIFSFMGIDNSVYYHAGPKRRYHSRSMSRSYLLVSPQD